MRVFSLLLVSTVICNAQQYDIPVSCRDLAIREGYPLKMTVQEQAMAKSNMSALDQKDPLVIKCKKAIQAIERMEKQGI